jgi:pyruvate/2-oxoglutarate dehydrogenase complex dihydrolipoamide acyltransferase (E2) component
MPTKIIMPQLGESVVEGTLSEWLKKPGDAVHEFESIARVSTDKVDTEIPAPAAGVLLAIHVHEGETVNAGVLLGVIGQPGESADAGSTSSATHAHNHAINGHAAPEPAVAVSAQSNGNGHGHDHASYGGHVTPVVARMATEHNLDLSQITGSGRDGRITKKDVLAYMENEPVPAAPSVVDDLPPWERPGSGDLFKSTSNYELDEPSKAPIAAPNMSAGVQRVAPSQSVQAASPETMRAAPSPIPSNSIAGELQALSAMRRSIAQHMVQSVQTSPHVTTVFEADLTAIVNHREANKAAFAKQGIKLTFTPYFVAACAAALRENPQANSRWTDEGIYLYQPLNIGIATAIDDGLIVPVLKNAGDYNLSGLARQINDLAERARSKQLKPDEVRDGTFTLTNHGVSGSLFATPIINQPQTAILGVGAIEKRVKVVNDAIAIRPCAYLSLTFDHRVLDGASADAFVSRVKAILEGWL